MKKIIKFKTSVKCMNCNTKVKKRYLPKNIDGLVYFNGFLVCKTCDKNFKTITNLKEL